MLRALVFPVSAIRYCHNKMLLWQDFGLCHTLYKQNNNNTSAKVCLQKSAKFKIYFSANLATLTAASISAHEALYEININTLLY